MKTIKARSTKLDAAALYWNERGEIGCLLPGHAPYRGTDTWVWDRWKKITMAEARGFEREIGRLPRCETCAAIERRAPEAQ